MVDIFKKYFSSHWKFIVKTDSNTESTNQLDYFC